MNRILINDELDTFLKREGYVVLPMLNEEEVELLRRLYAKWHPSDPEEFYKSYFSPNEVYKQEVESLTMQLFATKLEKLFVNYIPFGGMLVAKPSGPKGDFPSHQDWSFVDERKHWSLNMWSPLEDVNTNNGCLQILRGSHVFMHTIRGSGTKDQYHSQLGIITEHLTDIHMKAGEAIFFYHGVLHASTPNRSGKVRVSVGLSLIEKNAPIYYHFNHKNTDKTEEFLATVDFYINYVSQRDKMPETVVSNGFTDFTFPSLDNATLLQKINAANSYCD